MQMLLTVLTIFILISQNDIAAEINPVVHTKVGMIRGRQAADGNYSIFLGIPYAKVDEENPFGASLPHPAFETEFEAFDYSPQCPQIDFANKIVGSLDCLRLDVYVPYSATFNNRLPVMVWIKGGAFEKTREPGYYGPKYLVRHNVILITINFRVGVYGHMCLHTPEIPGNQGIKDQTAALRWINENIESFNGDVNKITLMGGSSGGRSIDFHIISSQKPLFHNAILQSGTSLTLNTILDADTDASLKLANELGFNTKQLNESLTFLAAMEPKLVVRAAEKLNLKCMPCIEKDFYNVERMIKDYTYNLKIPQAKNINILIGHTNKEQVVRYLNQDPKFYNDYLNVIYNRLRDYYNFEETELNKMVKLVHKFYLGDEKISPTTMSEIIDFDSFFTYVQSVQRSIQIYKENEANNIFYYIFAYYGRRSALELSINITEGNAGHTDELSYLFDTNPLRNQEVSPEDQMIIDRTTTLWTNFAKYGNPTPEVNELLPVKWLPVSQDTLYFYNIDTDIYLGKSPYHNESAFWDLFNEKNLKFQRGYREITDKP